MSGIKGTQTKNPGQFKSVEKNFKRLAAENNKDNFIPFLANGNNFYDKLVAAYRDIL